MGPFTWYKSWGLILHIDTLVMQMLSYLNNPDWKIQPLPDSLGIELY